MTNEGSCPPLIRNDRRPFSEDDYLTGEEMKTRPFGSKGVKKLYFSSILKMFIGKLSGYSVRRINWVLVVSCSGLLSMTLPSWVGDQCQRFGG